MSPAQTAALTGDVRFTEMVSICPDCFPLNCPTIMKAERRGSDQWIVCLFTAMAEMACRRACVQESTTA